LDHHPFIHSSIHSHTRIHLRPATSASESEYPLQTNCCRYNVDVVLPDHSLPWLIHSLRGKSLRRALLNRSNQFNNFNFNFNNFIPFCAISQSKYSHRFPKVTSWCAALEAARLHRGSWCYCKSILGCFFIAPHIVGLGITALHTVIRGAHCHGEAWLTSINRGDGACGKTSLLNVFTRGFASLHPLPPELS